MFRSARRTGRPRIGLGFPCSLHLVMQDYIWDDKLNALKTLYSLRFSCGSFFRRRDHGQTMSHRTSTLCPRVWVNEGDEEGTQ